MSSSYLSLSPSLFLPPSRFLSFSLTRFLSFSTETDLANAVNKFSPSSFFNHLYAQISFLPPLLPHPPSPFFRYLSDTLVCFTLSSYKMHERRSATRVSSGHYATTGLDLNLQTLKVHCVELSGIGGTPVAHRVELNAATRVRVLPVVICCMSSSLSPIPSSLSHSKIKH